MKKIFLISIILTIFSITNAQTYPSRIGNLCASDLAVATASSSHTGYPPSSAIDGDRQGNPCNILGHAPCWGNNGGWNDDTLGIFPDWLRVDFGRQHSISRIVVTTFQDNFAGLHPEPYLGLVVGHYGIENYYVEVLNSDNNWIKVGEIEENEDIIREFEFDPIVGSAIRLTVDDGYVGYSRVIEFEAYSK